MPFSPRWLVSKGREEEALRVLSEARGLGEEHDLVRIEFLEIKAQHLFEKQTSEEQFPQYQDGTFGSDFKLGFWSYFSLLRKKTLLYRVMVGTLTMFFQQWTGINAILYYAPSIFGQLGLAGNSIQLLATGVVGVAMFLTTIPAVLWVDQVGRKPTLISGAFLMAACHFIVAILTSLFHDSWKSHRAQGWVASAFVWIFAMGFGYSWGPCAWIIVAEIWPLSVRGKGMSIASSSNWMNNFIVGQVTPSMIEHLGFGTFIFFGVFSFLGGVFIWFFVPETKGLSLEEMDKVFGDSVGTAIADRERQARIHKSLGLDAYGQSDVESGGRSSDEKDIKA